MERDCAEATMPIRERLHPCATGVMLALGDERSARCAHASPQMLERPSAAPVAPTGQKCAFCCNAQRRNPSDHQAIISGPTGTIQCA